MLKTFNAGIGMVLVVAADRAEALSAALTEGGRERAPHRPGRAGGWRPLQWDASLTKRVAILISGGGSNMVRLADRA